MKHWGSEFTPEETEWIVKDKLEALEDWIRIFEFQGHISFKDRPYDDRRENQHDHH